MENINTSKQEHIKAENTNAPEPKLQKEEVQYVIQQNSQDKLLELMFTKGGEYFLTYLNVSAEKDKYTIEKQVEYEKEELKIVESLDKRDKLFKGLLLIVCIASMCILAYFEKAQSVAPVIGVIIGLLLKNSSITDFFTGDKKQKAKENTE